MSEKNYGDELARLRDTIDSADAIVVGADIDLVLDELLENKGR